MNSQLTIDPAQHCWGERSQLTENTGVKMSVAIGTQGPANTALRNKCSSNTNSSSGASLGTPLGEWELWHFLPVFYTSPKSRLCTSTRRHSSVEGTQNICSSAVTYFIWQKVPCWR